MATRSPYTHIRVKLPSFVVAVLRHRADEQHLDVSAVVERLLLENIWLDELQRVAAEVPDVGEAFNEWMRVAVRGSSAPPGTRRTAT
jgi:hypothetical protein